MNKIEAVPITTATHVWKSSDPQLRKCSKCGRKTTGKVKNVKAEGRGNAWQPLCSDCAFVKGFR